MTDGVTPPRYLVRFGYDGVGFAGWARQPGLRTVEGEVLEGIERLGIAADARSTQLAVSSRTDRGVSARGNALAISSALPPVALLRALNGISGEIFFTHILPVAEGFRPRGATQRWYRYWEGRSGRIPPSWKTASKILRGRVDARSFGRGLSGSGPTWRTLDVTEPEIDSGWLVLNVKARSFVWGMVRKIVSAVRQVQGGRLKLSELAEAVRGERRLSLPLAEPERLVLWETSYPVEWPKGPSGTVRQERRSREAAGDALARHEILTQVWEARRE